MFKRLFFYEIYRLAHDRILRMVLVLWVLLNLAFVGTMYFLNQSFWPLQKVEFQKQEERVRQYINQNALSEGPNQQELVYWQDLQKQLKVLASDTRPANQTLKHFYKTVEKGKDIGSGSLSVLGYSFNFIHEQLVKLDYYQKNSIQEYATPYQTDRNTLLYQMWLGFPVLTLLLLLIFVILVWKSFLFEEENGIKSLVFDRGISVTLVYLFRTVSLFIVWFGFVFISLLLCSIVSSPNTPPVFLLNHQTIIGNSLTALALKSAMVWGFLQSLIGYFVVGFSKKIDYYFLLSSPVLVSCLLSKQLPVSMQSIANAPISLLIMCLFICFLLSLSIQTIRERSKYKRRS